MRVLTVAASRALDRAASERFSIPSIVLMENAAVGMTRIAAELLGGLDERRVLVAAGPGNNGGDAYVIARHLHNAGAVVAILPVGRPREESDAGRNATIVLRMGLRHAGAELLDEPWNLIVDGLFGSGLDRPLEGSVREVVARMNAHGSPILAVDLPSGLDGDSGRPLGLAIEADMTAVTVAPRPAMFVPEAQRWIGAWRVVDIGAPRELLEELGTPR